MDPINRERGGPVQVDYCPYCMAQVEPDKPCPSCGLTVGSYKSQPKHLPAGTVLRERYLVGRVLGEGGFGITYIGRDLVLGLKVAIKEYFPTDRASRNCAVSVSVESFLGNQSDIFEKGKQRFLEEARTMARLDRLPNIVGVRDFFEENATAYIVMEYIDGTTLSALVEQRGGAMPAWELLHLIEPLFDSLGAMHELGLIHRDISPDNLMLEHGIIKLLDFGCAREAADGDATMTIMLRHGYAPLEQYQSSSGAQGAWTDVYALAATIYFCITGKKPPQSMDRIFQDDLIPPRKLGADLTASQEEALLRAMKVKPKARFQSVKEFHTALYEGAVTVHFDAGEDAVTDVCVVRGDKLKAEDMPVPKREGYVFTGWFLDEGRKKPVRDVEVMGKCTLYAGWQKEDPEVPEKVPLWKNRMFRIGAAAAAVIAIVLAVAIPLGSRTSGPGDGTQGGTEPVESGPRETEGSSTQPAQPKVVTVSTLQALKDCLADDSVDAVTVSAVSFRIDEPLEITKPVTVNCADVNITSEVSVTSELSFTRNVNSDGGFITVSGEGACLTLEGGYSGMGVVHTEKGGKIRCEDEGATSFDFLWLADRSDLDLSGVFWTQILIFDEEKIFAGAAHVNSIDELNAAMGDPMVTAVVLDKDLSGASLYVSKPLLISEGVTVTDSGYQNITSTLVNRGVMTGEDTIEIETDATLLNEGVCNAVSVSLSQGRETMLVNTGQLTASGGRLLRYSVFVNMGQFRLVESESDDPMNANGLIYNYGEFEQTGEASLQLEPSAEFNNNFGSVRLGGSVSNNGMVFHRGGGDFILSGEYRYGTGFFEVGAGFATTGGVQLTDATLYGDPEVIAGLSLSEDCRVLLQRWIQTELPDVTDAEALQKAVASGGARIPDGTDIQIDGDLTVRGDLVLETGSTLTLTGTLTVENGALLALNGTAAAHALVLKDGAGLTTGAPDVALDLAPDGELALLSGSSAVIYSLMEMNGAALRLEDSSMLHWGTINGSGSVTLSGAAVLFDVNGLGSTDGYTVGSGSFFQSQSFDVSTSVTVESGARLCVSCAPSFRDGCVVTNHGDMTVYASDFNIEEGAKLINDGFLGLSAWEQGSGFIYGTVENRCVLYFSNDMRLEPSGVIENWDTWELQWCGLTSLGRIDNHGEVVIYRTDSVYNTSYITNQGTWTGAEPVYRNNP